MAQYIRSGYGRKGIRVDDRCPTRAIRHHLGRTHVGTPVSEVSADVQAEIDRQKVDAPDDWSPLMVRQALRFTQWQHEENRAEYRYVMGGTS